METGKFQKVSFTKANGDAAGPVPLHLKALLQTLADELPVHSIRFSSKIFAIETQQNEGLYIAIVHMEDGTIIKAKVLIGCDRFHSLLSSGLGRSELLHSGRSAVHGLVVYPQGHRPDQQNLRQCVGSSRRADFVPLNEKEMYWFFFGTDLCKGTSLLEDPEDIQKEILGNYAKDLPHIYLDVVQHEISTMSWAPLKFRNPWGIVYSNLSKQNITVAGDAMHLMTPDLGQGGCLGLEDAVILGRHIGKSFLHNGHVLVSKEMNEVLRKYVEE